MSVGGSKQGTGDPLRDAIIAQGQERSALDDLHDHYAAQEKELLLARETEAAADRVATLQWRPPTEEEFNYKWVTPLEALEVSELRMADDHQLWAIVERLRAGQIIAVARTGQLRADLQGVKPFMRINCGAWRRMDQSAEFFFWKTGDLVIPAVLNPYMTGTDLKDRYFDIRFDPATFSGRPAPRFVDDEMTQADAPIQPLPGNKGGRPPKPFWEDLYVEMFDQLWHGKLTPENQAAIENAMADWVSANGHVASERSIRLRAQKLWKVWTKEGNN